MHCGKIKCVSSRLWSVNIWPEIVGTYAESSKCITNNITPVRLYSCSVYSREKLQNELLQLVSRRHHISTATQNLRDLTSMRHHLLTLDGMLKLQEDVVTSYLIGRPRIQNISSIHIPFSFRASKSTSEAHPLKYVLLF